MNPKTKSAIEYVMWAIVGAVIGWFVTSCLIGCCSSPAPVSNEEREKSDRVYFTVRNDTDQHLYGQISGGLMGRSIDLEPNSEKSFWGYRSMVPSKITVAISDKAPAARRK